MRQPETRVEREETIKNEIVKMKTRVDALAEKKFGSQSNYFEIQQAFRNLGTDEDRLEADYITAGILYGCWIADPEPVLDNESLAPMHALANHSALKIFVEVYINVLPFLEAELEGKIDRLKEIQERLEEIPKTNNVSLALQNLENLEEPLTPEYLLSLLNGTSELEALYENRIFSNNFAPALRDASVTLARNANDVNQQITESRGKRDRLANTVTLLSLRVEDLNKKEPRQRRSFSEALGSFRDLRRKDLRKKVNTFRKQRRSRIEIYTFTSRQRALNKKIRDLNNELLHKIHPLGGPTDSKRIPKLKSDSRRLIFEIDDLNKAYLEIDALNGEITSEMDALDKRLTGEIATLNNKRLDEVKILSTELVDEITFLQDLQELQGLQSDLDTASRSDLKRTGQYQQRLQEISEANGDFSIHAELVEARTIGRNKTADLGDTRYASQRLLDEIKLDRTKEFLKDYTGSDDIRRFLELYVLREINESPQQIKADLSEVIGETQRLFSDGSRDDTALRRIAGLTRNFLSEETTLPRTTNQEAASPYSAGTHGLGSRQSDTSLSASP